MRRCRLMWLEPRWRATGQLSAIDRIGLAVVEVGGDAVGFSNGRFEGAIWVPACAGFSSASRQGRVVGSYR